MILSSQQTESSPLNCDSLNIAPSSDHNYSVLDNGLLGHLLNVSLTATEELNTPVIENKTFLSSEDALLTSALSPPKGAIQDIHDRPVCDWNTSLLEPLAGNEDSVPIDINIPLELPEDIMMDQNEKLSNIDSYSKQCYVLDTSESEIPTETFQEVPGAEISPQVPQDTVFDYDLTSVALDAITSGDLSPIIKEELKSTILAKRLLNGLEEPTIEFKPEGPEQITPEIEEQRKDRRERNKLAARKCRNKKKERCDSLQEEITSLENKNETLILDIRKLREEHDHLLVMYKTHLGTRLCTKTMS
jgi:hypothetical protein